MEGLKDSRRPPDEIAKWDGETGAKWVRHAADLDKMLSPFSEAVVGAVGRHGPILDVGCGAGALTIRLAQIAGAAVGVDVSDALLTLAWTRADAACSPAVFLRQDAARHRTAVPYDTIASRFGVMFFDDPARAFSNLHAATRPGGELVFTAWRDLSRNPWAELPVRLAEPLLGHPFPPPPAGTPGPFAFADDVHVRALLNEAGWSDIVLTPVRSQIVLPGRNERDAAAFIVTLGPMSGKLEKAGIDPAHLAEVVSDHLSHDQYGDIALPGEAWLVQARA